MGLRGRVVWPSGWSQPVTSHTHPTPQPSSVKSLRTERLIRTSLDLELDLQATRTWHSQLTQEISVLRELKEQLEQAKSHGEKELPQWLREDERFRLLLRMLEKRVSAWGLLGREAKGPRMPTEGSSMSKVPSFPSAEGPWHPFAHYGGGHKAFGG